jgi:hypothetical protein
MVCFTVCGTLAFAAVAAAADGPGEGGGRAAEHGTAGPQKGLPAAPRGVPDQDVARDAVRRGLVNPLDSVLPTVGRAVPGRVVAVQLGQDSSGAWLYHFRVVRDDGRYAGVTVNATTNVVVATGQF